MRRWQLQEAKARFSAFLKASLAEGPQIVTKHGQDRAVLIRIELWRELQRGRGPGLKELLLAPEQRQDDLVAQATARQQRPPPTLD